MVQCRRPSRSSWTQSVRSSFGRTVMGKAIWENPIAARLGKGFQLGMLVRTPSKRVILTCVCGWDKTWLERNKTLIRCGNYSTKKSFWENQHLSLIVYTWDALKDIGEISKDIVDNYRTMCGIDNFRGESREISIPSKSSYFFMVLWHGWSCKEMCGTILRGGKQDDSTTLQSIFSMHRWPPLLRRRNEICWRIATSMLSNCSKMLIFGTNWKTRYSVVIEQTCTINHKINQSLWQTPESIDFIYSSHMWIQTILSCG